MTMNMVTWQPESITAHYGCPTSVIC